MTKQCIFCSSSPATKEDLFPRWMLRLLKLEFDTQRSRKGAMGRTGASYWSSDKPLEAIVKCVCRTCNTGWMSDVESAVQPALAGMIRGEKGIALDTAMQGAVATWACLKTTVAAYSWGTHPMPDDWLQHLYSEHLPPEGWHVLTTRYVGRFLQMLDTHRFILPNPTGKAIPATNQDRGVLTTLIIGQLAIHIRALREPTVLKIRSATLKVWPSSPLTLLWPPAQQIRDGRTLENFRRMGFEPGPELFGLPPT